MTASSFPTRFAAFVLAVLLPFALTGCGDSHDKILKDSISVMNRVADTLATVKDKASAEAARDNLKSLGEEMKTLEDRMNKLGKPTGDAEKALRDKYEKEMEEAAVKMKGGMMQIATAGPEALELLKDVMKDMKNVGE